MKASLNYFGEVTIARVLRSITVALMTSLAGACTIQAQVATVGAGAYATTLPAKAKEPPATIFTTQKGPVRTHQYWSSKLFGAFTGGANMVPQPLFTNATGSGMKMGIHGNVDGYPNNDASAIAFYQYPNLDLTIGNAALSASNVSAVNLSASSDWSADFNFGPSLTVRTGRGMPFAYALTDGTPVTVTFARKPTVVIDNGNILAVSTPEGDGNFTNYYGLFCPMGGTWAQSGMVFTCNAPAGSNYMSVALLPGLLSGSNGNRTPIATQLTDYSAVAFSFPTDTKVSWNYNESASTIATTYAVTTQSMDGKSMGFLQALYPTQYDSLPGAVNTPYLYLTNHGVMKVNSGLTFTITDTFHGILPMMPATSKYDMAKLKGYVDNSPAAVLSASDYEQGKILGAAAQVLPLAQIADPAAYTTLQGKLQNILQTWFTATTTSGSDLFYYNKNWGTMIAYPASFDEDDQINDHHFHFGYFIHAAAINGLFNPSWIADGQYGGMVRLLQQDIGNYDRKNTMFPFLRHFDVYAGHSWASGLGGFDVGENQESSSEAVNAWTGMILLGAANGDLAMRDAGIWMYTQETKAAAYYWFNEKPSWVNANATSTFPSWFAPLRIANEFDGKADVSTFFGSNPDFEHAIEFLPFTGGSLHLGYSPVYVEKNYQEDQAANLLTKVPNGDWPDLMAMYEALSNPATAQSKWGNPTAATDGDTLAHEYAWIQSLLTLGQVDVTVTANTPFYAVFNNGGAISHVAFNPSSAPITVTFSDSTSLTVPAGTLNSDNPLVPPFTFGGGIQTALPPAAPVGLVANVKSSTEVDVAWASTSNVTWTLYRSTTSGFVPSGANAVASGLTVAAYADTTLTAGTTYYYVVEAVSAAGSSAPSTQVSAKTTGTSGGGGGGTAVPEMDKIYLVGGASLTNPGLLSFTAGTSGNDVIPVNAADSIGTVLNPLIYTITGVSGTYDSAATTAFDMFVDAGTNPGEGVQVQVLYDPTGSGTFTRTETSSMFATDAAAGNEDYRATSRGPVKTTGTLTNMMNGTIQVKIWMVLPGVNDAPISLSVGNNTAALSNLVIPFTTITQTVAAAVPPASVTATAASSSQVNVAWQPSSTVGVTYNVYRSNSVSFTPSASNLIVGSLSTTSYSDLNLNASTTYSYIVEAVNALGSSKASAVASATTPAQVGPITGSSTLQLVSGANVTNPSLLSFVGGPAGVDAVPVNNPQSPDTVANPLVYTIKGLNGKYDNTMMTAFNMYIDAGMNAGEAAQVEVLYDLTGSGMIDRTELYHFFATDPVVGYELYNQTSRGGLEKGTGTLGDMTNGTVTIKVWNALPGPNAGAMSLSVGANANAQSSVTLPFNTISQNPGGPAAPTSIMAVAKSANEIDLSWMASTTNNATYKIYRSATAGFTPAMGNLLGTATGTTYADMGLAPASTLYYVVASTNAAGTTPGAQVMATTLSTPSMTTLSISAPSIFLAGTETLTASVAPAAATGTVTFKDGNTTLMAVALAAGQAMYTTGPLGGGSHSFTAVYSGDNSYAASTSAAVTLNVPTVPPDFTFGATPSSTLVGAGATASYTLNLAPLGGFNSAVSFTCDGLPAGAVCSFSPATVTLDGANASTGKMSVSTSGSATASVEKPGSGSSQPFYLAFLPLGVGFFLLGSKARRKSMRRLMVGGGFLMVVCLFTGCAANKFTTPTSINTVTITAKAGALVHTTTVTLDVQQY